MSWAYGINAKGREVGYSVPATCARNECSKDINCGLAYCCGGMHDGGEFGCGDYFCEEHLYHFGNEQDETPGAVLCAQCGDAWLAEHPDREISA